MPFQILALIAARSGSVGLRHKNVKRLEGVPLLARAVDLAQRSQRQRENWSIVVSTDSSHYARIAQRAGAEVPFLRPRRLAQHQSRLIDAVLHTLCRLERHGRVFDAVLLLSPTTPLTAPKDIRGALALFRRSGGDAVASVVRDPYADSWRFSIEGDKVDRHPRTHRVSRRQEDGSVRVVLNGAIYIATSAWLHRYRQFVQCGRTRPFLMPRLRSLDIDTQEDFDIVNALLRGQRFSR